MSWNAKYVILIVGTTVISFYSGIVLEKAQSMWTKKFVIVVSLLICLGILFVFKYLDFFFESLNTLFRLLSIPLSVSAKRIVLPIGISFYTFQSISYVLDVYKGDIKAEKHLGKYAAFVSFFPQLVAGPIERASNLLPQIKNEHYFDTKFTLAGLKLMLLGYYKKIVIADNIAIYVDKVYGDLRNFHGFALVLATFFFTLQIYCDFSGYSDIARGTARLFGIELMRNFKSPYYSSSLEDFWDRWHISLSSWLQDYVYKPLGGSRNGTIRHYINLMITFLISGLWHGANWTFVVWGGIHGLAQILEKNLKMLLRRLRRLSLFHLLPLHSFRILRVVIVFCFVNVAWVFFRAQCLSDAMYLFSTMFHGILHPIKYFNQGFMALDITMEHFMFCLLIYLVPLSIVDYWGLNSSIDGLTVFEKLNQKIQWVLLVCLGLVVVFFSQKGVATEFVYFQF